MAQISFAEFIQSQDLALRRSDTSILQLNIGKLCNLTCSHCHVNAGPARREIMSRDTIDHILDWLQSHPIDVVDLTGGAPEMIPDFQYLVESIRSIQPDCSIIDRCNLTILLHPDFSWLPEFLKSNQVHIVASMPCYSPENVNAQRGDGVFDQSIKALKILNSLGFGHPNQPNLQLDLVYNPIGPSLPPTQSSLESDYKDELDKHFSIKFNKLLTITNMPISRFASYLKNNNQLTDYMALLRNAFNPATLDGLMCRHTLNVSWEGEVFDCDFNQMLNLPIYASESQHSTPSRPKLWEISPESLINNPIATGNHCFACTAGAGSSCSGSLE